MSVIQELVDNGRVRASTAAIQRRATMFCKNREKLGEARAWQVVREFGHRGAPKRKSEKDFREWVLARVRDGKAPSRVEVETQIRAVFGNSYKTIRKYRRISQHAADSFLFPTISVRQPHSTLIFHSSADNRRAPGKHYESRSTALLRAFRGSYMLLHVASRIAHNAAEAVEIGRELDLPTRFTEPCDAHRGAVIAVLEIGDTRLLRGHLLRRGKCWARKLFVSTHKLKSIYVTRILRVHHLPQPVYIERGFQYVFSHALRSADLPEGLCPRRLARNSEQEAKWRSFRAV